MMCNALRPLIAGNWKMHGLAAQLREIETIAAYAHAKRSAADVLIYVPATLLFRAVQAAAGRIAVGGEDCHAGASGPFTDDVSAGMLRDAGSKAVIVGYSERRRHHCETDQMVAAKAVAAGRAGADTCPLPTKSPRFTCTSEPVSSRSPAPLVQTSAFYMAGRSPRTIPTLSSD